MSKPEVYEWPFRGNAHQGTLWRFNSIIVQTVVWGVARLWTSWPVSTKVLYNADVFHEFIDKRLKERKERGYNRRPLITVSNHRCCIDEPLLWGALVPWRHIRAGQLRWVPTASELTFSNRLLSFMFGHGRCVPVVRGQGVYQQGVDFCVERLNEGQWVQVFPEGKINLANEKRLKWGVGRMIADSNVVPDVIPIWHIGMDDVLPNHSPYIPRVGQTIVVYVGEPISMEKLVDGWKREIKDPIQLRKVITDFLQVEFWELKEMATRHHQNAIKSADRSREG